MKAVKLTDIRRPLSRTRTNGSLPSPAHRLKSQHATLKPSAETYSALQTQTRSKHWRSLSQKSAFKNR